MKRIILTPLLSLGAFLLLLSCSQTTEPPAVFVKADPSVDAILDRHPRTVRVFLTALPDIKNSDLRLFGEQGEISLSRFHSMGADDLMIEIDDHPLPNGVYRVEWSAVVENDEMTYHGKYQFTVAVE